MSKNLRFASSTVWILSLSSLEALHSNSTSHNSWYSWSGSSHTPRFWAIPYPWNYHVGHTSSQALQKSGEWWNGRDSQGPVLRWPCFLLSTAKSLIIPLQEERRLGVLFNITQGGRTVAEYPNEFCTVMALSKLNTASLFDTFYKGLSDYIKEELAAQEPLIYLNALIPLTVCIDGHLCSRGREKALSTHCQESPWGWAELNSVLQSDRVTCGTTVVRTGVKVAILSPPVIQKVLVSWAMYSNVPSCPASVFINSRADTYRLNSFLATWLYTSRKPLI